MPRKRKSKSGGIFNLMGLPFIAKLVIAFVLDFIDFTAGRIPLIGTLYDVFVMGITLAMIGPMGALAGWEVVGDPTEQIDGFIPTASILVLLTEMG